MDALYSEILALKEHVKREERQRASDKDYQIEMLRHAGMDSANSALKLVNSHNLIVQLRDTVVQLVEQVSDLSKEVGRLKQQQASVTGEQVDEQEIFQQAGLKMKENRNHVFNIYPTCKSKYNVH